MTEDDLLTVVGILIAVAATSVFTGLLVWVYYRGRS